MCQATQRDITDYGNIHHSDLLLKTIAISDTHGGEYEDFWIVTPCSWKKETTAFRGNVLPPCSG
jgi:hypothetical protein